LINQSSAVMILAWRLLATTSTSTSTSNIMFPSHHIKSLCE
jgi:hypothetical protein